MKLTNRVILTLVCAGGIAACASKPASTDTSAAAAKPTTPAATAGTPAKPAAAPAARDPNMRIVKSRDGKFDGEMVGFAAVNSKFAKLQIGMELNEVTKMIGGGDAQYRHETGKRWIPFYFGNDVQRIVVTYNNEGCLAFTGGNQFGAGGNELIRITADPSLARCKE
jgi:ABC-type amino acid transport substrate-binding protein